MVKYKVKGINWKKIFGVHDKGLISFIDKCSQSAKCEKSSESKIKNEQRE